MTEREGTKPERFEIRVEPRELDELRVRLQKTRWTHAAEDTGWELGARASYLHELTAYWSSSYDWRAQEAKLNALPQFKARVGDANLHFVHMRARGTRPMPLLLLHGWPDSFYRFHKVIPKLADPERVGGDPSVAFDLVAPSLPGFAFTGPVQHPAGSQPSRHSAQLLWKLMTEVLGYERFMIAGGDGGSVIAQLIAIDHPKSVIGVHLTDIGWHAFNRDPSSVTDRERKYLAASQKHFQKDGAYVAVQTTRPRSLVGLNDSPAGLAAWIVDRFHSWCDFDHELEASVTRDELLTNIMLYWLTQTIGSSMFNYYAEARSPSLKLTDRVERPVALALFPKDIGGIPPRRFAERTLNVQRWTEMPRGGHFAALEQPALFTNDLLEFARTLRASPRQSEQEASDGAANL